MLLLSSMAMIGKVGHLKYVKIVSRVPDPVASAPAEGLEVVTALVGGSAAGVAATAGEVDLEVAMVAEAVSAVVGLAEVPPVVTTPLVHLFRPTRSRIMLRLAVNAAQLSMSAM